MDYYDIDTFYGCNQTDNDLNDLIQWEQQDAPAQWSFEEWELNHLDKARV